MVHHCLTRWANHRHIKNVGSHLVIVIIVQTKKIKQHRVTGLAELQNSSEGIYQDGGRVKITRRQLGKIIKETLSFVAEAAKKYTCPAATQDLKLNTKNRDSAIKADYIQYGPLNLTDEAYWERAAEHWNTEPDVAKKSKCYNCVAFDISPRMQDCMPGLVMDQEAIEEAIKNEEPWETLGYCWMHSFKCHSARTCYTWAAGGPITEDKVSHDWQERNEEKI